VRALAAVGSSNGHVEPDLPESEIDFDPERWGDQS
jgi:hypothetical protein